MWERQADIKTGREDLQWEVLQILYNHELKVHSRLALGQHTLDALERALKRCIPEIKLCKSHVSCCHSENWENVYTKVIRQRFYINPTDTKPHPCIMPTQYGRQEFIAETFCYLFFFTCRNVRSGPGEWKLILDKYKRLIYNHKYLESYCEFVLVFARFIAKNFTDSTHVPSVTFSQRQSKNNTTNTDVNLNKTGCFQYHMY